jgi:hypothetical protein
MRMQAARSASFLRQSAAVLFCFIDSDEGENPRCAVRIGVPKTKLAADERRNDADLSGASHRTCLECGTRVC